MGFFYYVLANLFGVWTSLFVNSPLSFFSYLCQIANLVNFLQYGHIVEIELKVPPRPPGYAFVEVSSLLGIESLRC